MARAEDESEDEMLATDELDPVSGMRKKQPGEGIYLLIAQLRARAEGLDGAELDAEIERFKDKLIERHVKVAPDAMREEMRETFREMLELNPTIGAMIEELRQAVRRG